MQTLKLWLMRHGETTVNAGLWSADPLHCSLTQRGKEQIRQAISEITEQPDLIITSSAPRSQESAAFISEAWPTVHTCVWPIEEFIYLSPAKLNDLSVAGRKERINAYWEQSDPFYQDGEGAESFANFFRRIEAFHEALATQKGFIIAAGHGQFFKAYLLCLIHGFEPSAMAMQRFRKEETAAPIKNGEIIQIQFAICKLANKKRLIEQKRSF